MDPVIFTGFEALEKHLPRLTTFHGHLETSLLYNSLDESNKGIDGILARQ